MSGAPVQGGDTEGHEIRGFYELRKDLDPVERGIGGVIDHGSVVMSETHEAGVFHPVALARSCREYRSFRDLGIRWEGARVVRRCEPVDDFDCLECDGTIHALPVDIPDRRFELLESEMRRQWIEAHARDVIERPQLLQLGRQGLFVVDRGSVTGGHHVPARLVHHDLPAGVDHARTELDGRDVPLADCPQTCLLYTSDAADDLTRV